jgi:hypothetical protein
MGKISKAAKDVVQSLRNLDEIVKGLGRAALNTEKALARSGKLTATPSSTIETVGMSARAGVKGASPELLRRVDQRARHLQGLLKGQKLQGTVTIGVGVGRDRSGNIRNVVGSSEKGGYLRREVREALGKNEEQAKFVGPNMHAEPRIIEYMKRNDIDPIAVGAGRPICNQCEPVIDASGAVPASPLKGAPPRG